MQVELLQHGNLAVVIRAIRTCYDSMGKSDSRVVEGEFILGAHDKELLGRILSSGHDSTIEHLSYTFYIKGVSRGLLQELARHRIASLSVKSTRYTLGRLKNVAPFMNEPKEVDGCTVFDYNWDHINEYLVPSDNTHVNQCAAQALENLRVLSTSAIPNDQLKYCLPEALKTELIWTINARSLRNFLKLRLAPQAHWEIRKLAETVLCMLPEEHAPLFT